MPVIAISYQRTEVGAALDLALGYQLHNLLHGGVARDLAS